MENVVGVLVGEAIVVAILALQTLCRISPWQQMLIMIGVAVVNLLVWQRSPAPPMPVRTALRHLGLGLLLIAGVSLIDILIGKAAGDSTLVEAFIHSGMFGGILDCFFMLMLVLVGIPTLARSVWLYAKLQSTSDLRNQ